LPALPASWADGSFRGVCARGAFELNFSWKDKQVNSLQILSKAGRTCRIANPPGTRILCKGIPVAHTELPGGIIEFNTVKGETYVLE
jgi:alpha-L-fucosidase 2